MGIFLNCTIYNYNTSLYALESTELRKIIVGCVLLPLQFTRQSDNNYIISVVKVLKALLVIQNLGWHLCFLVFIYVNFRKGSREYCSAFHKVRGLGFSAWQSQYSKACITLVPIKITRQFDCTENVQLL